MIQRIRAYVLVSTIVSVVAAWPCFSQIAITVPRDSGKLVGMGVVCGGETRNLALQHVKTINLFLNRLVTDLFREDAAQAFNDAKELAAASQASGRGFSCAEVQVLLRHAERDIRRILPAK